MWLNLILKYNTPNNREQLFKRVSTGMNLFCFCFLSSIDIYFCFVSLFCIVLFFDCFAQVLFREICLEYMQLTYILVTFNL